MVVRVVMGDGEMVVMVVVVVVMVVVMVMVVRIVIGGDDVEMVVSWL